ncbi:O-methyltransferase [Epilithonimonas sp. UC225_85]|uniref:O-methyltransferase n=1 Tax=Epilithonimonas sp. UC225_85 TaxID=3350167 RepID=UPI0036D42F4E
MSYFEELDKEMDRYLEDNASEEPAILKKLRKETYQKTTHASMISGYLQGRLLSIISNMIKPKNILEIGTFTGYSALSIAEGLPQDGKLYTIDKNEDLAYLPQKYFEESEYKDKIEFIIGDAKEEIKKLDKIWDLVFIDADKESYLTYFELIKPNLVSGSIILVDNVLWHGKVIQESAKDKSTEQIKLVNKIVSEDPDFENLILPLRDGLHLIRKK